MGRERGEGLDLTGLDEKDIITVKRLVSSLKKKIRIKTGSNLEILKKAIAKQV